MLAMYSRPANGTLFKDLSWGVFLGASSLAVSYCIGSGLLHNLYYLEWLAASIMGFYILIAWLLWLRDDAFMKRRQTEPAPASSKRARQVLLSASLFLALATIVLYFGFRIGASF
ncbi:MAG: hypothetical protein CVV53_01215 [Spirochaetae bacterium HGW-Spirochaetae-9]|nr:MAG: hypothetical protein CVV53_01215 [Spirochaetae bacterium HGW-Spirochaetae-9]